jgi:phosphoglycolate phosphatase
MTDQQPPTKLGLTDAELTAHPTAFASGAMKDLFVVVSEPPIQMTRYRLAIFDFDGTLADSLPWFRASFQDMITRFDLAPVGADEIEGLRGMSGRQIMARLNVPMWRLPAIVSDMRKRKLAAAGEISLFDGVEEMLSDMQRLGIRTAIVSSDTEESVRRVLGPVVALVSRFDCGAAIFGKHRKFRRVARQLGIKPADTICIRDIEAAGAAGMASGAVAWGYAFPAALQAAGPTHFFSSIAELTHRLANAAAIAQDTHALQGCG